MSSSSRPDPWGELRRFIQQDEVIALEDKLDELMDRAWALHEALYQTTYAYWRVKKIADAYEVPITQEWDAGWSLQVVERIQDDFIERYRRL